MQLWNKFRSLSKSQKYYLSFISFVWIHEYFATIWRRLGIENADIPNAFILLLLFFLSRNQWKGRIKFIDFSAFIILGIAYILSPMIYPETEAWVESKSFSFLFATLSFIFVGLIFNSSENTYWLIRLCRLAVVINISFMFIRAGSGAEAQEEQMHRAYILLPSVLYLIWQTLESYSKTNLFFSLVGFFIVCSMGSRGPFVCILFFMGIYLFFFKEYRYKKMIRFCIIVCSAVLYQCSKDFAEFMIVILAKFNLSTRIFDKLLENSLVNYESSSARDSIHALLFDKLRLESDGIGFGFFSDRIKIGGYAHNIFIELWFDFGYIIGSIFALSILLLAFYYITRNNINENEKIFSIILFTVSLVKLQFSGSYILDTGLFFFIGYCINGIRRNYKHLKI